MTDDADLLTQLVDETRRLTGLLADRDRRIRDLELEVEQLRSQLRVLEKASR
jgi:cell division protein FtsL